MKKKLIKVTASILVLSFGMSVATFAEEANAINNETMQEIDYEVEILPEADVVQTEEAETLTEALSQEEVPAAAEVEETPTENETDALVEEERQEDQQDLQLYANISYPVTGGNIYFNPSTGNIVDCDTSVTSAIVPKRIDGKKGYRHW